MRTVDRLEGLALLGHGSVGPVRFPVPALLDSRAVGEVGTGVYLESLGESAGRRQLRLGVGEDHIDLDLPIIAPDVIGPGAGAHPAGPRVVLVHAPLASEDLKALRRDPPELLVLGNARALWSEGRPFVETIRSLREGVGARPLLWAPRVALPHRLPFLLYLGVDLVDTTEGRLAATHGAYLDAELGEADPAATRAERSCPCPGCAGPESVDRDLHARSVYGRAFATTRAAARSGRLRELVEARTVAEPALGEMLRYADRDLERLLDERTPVVGGASHGYVLAESHRRPEMLRFRRRLAERYRPPPSKEVLLLVPCSKTKPYRISRSHRRFAAALEGLRRLERIHVVSVSSPIGLVPRELEDVPPARQYDIPVTGEWSEAERSAVLEGLGHLLRSGPYRRAVVHLDPVEYGFLRTAFPPTLAVEWTLPDDRTTSAEALRSLRAAAEWALAESTSVAGGPLAVVREELREVAAVQFGRELIDPLFAPPIRLAGRPWFQRLTDGKTDLATLREERGLFHLTVAGARRLAAPYPLAVDIDPTLTLAGDLFTPGVRHADLGIRVGDSVVLLRNGRLAAVGEAALPGPLMTELERGLAVHVRHRAHGSTDTTMTKSAPRPDEGPVVQR